jgi:diguanylate cyclase (GGDEF)-like protein/PAS domain S-box-containing protein
MPLYTIFPAEGAQSGVDPAEALRTALIDSRQRWRDLVSLAADIAFETDAQGRFTFLDPDEVLGWDASLLLGQSGPALLVDGEQTGGFNPFLTKVAVRRRQAWIRRRDGGAACVSFTIVPLYDAQGSVVGVRGVGLDITDNDGREARMAAALRRGQVIDHILRCMRDELLAPRMMEAALAGLGSALGAEGAAVIEVVGPDGMPSLLYDMGQGAGWVVPVVVPLLLEDEALDSGVATAPDGRPVLVCGCRTRFGELMGLALWRVAGARTWDAEERVLASSAATIVRVILEHDAIQREMGRQARTDPLTGLYNRRAFLEELDRHIERLEREDETGTLMFLDLDHFKELNDARGHDAGDEALRIVAALLRRTVRPTDIVARLGGDEFAVWMNGADHFTAAERAEALRLQAPLALGETCAGLDRVVTLSIGIATRRAGSGEDIDSLLHRADLAMYDVKRAGRAGWRVATP